MKDKVKWMNKENKNKDSRMKCDFILAYFSFSTATNTKHLLLFVLNLCLFKLC